uniref:Amine oxidase n=1 Tax=Ditylenchus dipsaci TaxID=166011 RepID=A0A915DLB1_9BILA
MLLIYIIFVGKTFKIAKMSVHPLRPLDSSEVQAAVTLLKTLPNFTPKTRIIWIMLKEPAKDLVYRWDDNQGFALPPREATAILQDNGINRASTITLNLTDNKVVEFVQAPPGAQAAFSMDEEVEVEELLKQSPLFKEALQKHYGISDTSLIMADIWSVGYYGSEEERTTRMARPICFLRSDPTDNGYARPLEGFRPVVDVNKMEVIRIEEYGKWPLPPNPANYAYDKGPSYTLNGNHIAWQKWDFVIGFNAREALTIHDLRYNDNGKKRPICLVPYGDPRPTQRRKNAFDVGEYGIGACANSLHLGCDCLGYINYLDANLADSRGRSLTIKNAICIHEEDTGVLWKHTDRRMPERAEVRRSRRLVVSSISTVENYEYSFFWYFYQDGNIEFEIKLSGILSVGCVHDGDHLPWGTMVAPLVYAPNHQHFFSFRIDFAVDGIQNTIQQLDVVPDPEDEEHNPFHNAFRSVATELQTERQAMANVNSQTNRCWRVINPAMKNALQKPVGYRFLPGGNSLPLGSPKAWWRKRGAFVDHHVWVTPFKDKERYAAGDFPNQCVGGDGLVKWTAHDRPIANTDVVFWYNFALTHIPRIEEYPIMSTEKIGFSMVPDGFFNQNPAVDVPPPTKQRPPTPPPPPSMKNLCVCI